MTVALTQPDDSLRATFVNESHQRDLESLFYEVGLVDTYRVDPHRPRHGGVPQSMQRSSKVFRDRDLFTIDADVYLSIWIAPAI